VGYDELDEVGYWLLFEDSRSLDLLLYMERDGAFLCRRSTVKTGAGKMASFFAADVSASVTPMRTQKNAWYVSS
jgi:hypothetical protein